MANYLIIGASTGIGYALSQQLLAEGNTVFGTYNKTPTASNHSSFTMHAVNVLDENINLDFLPDQIDGIAYCPGSINLKPFARIKPEEFTADFNLQVVGAVKIIQAILPKLKTSPLASIVLFSTVAVQNGFNFHAQVATSKGAIEGLCRSLSAELAPTIRINCIAPSLTDTPLASSLINTEEKRMANAQRHPLKKIGTADDIANMANFLLSPKASWMTGQVLHVDGGMGVVK
jgi:NAD(P)-dependent dehydrogenase (short-subunit alcohol dehydrogenase family)